MTSSKFNHFCAHVLTSGMPSEVLKGYANMIHSIAPLFDGMVASEAFPTINNVLYPSPAFISELSSLLAVMDAVQISVSEAMRDSIPFINDATTRSGYITGDLTSECHECFDGYREQPENMQQVEVTTSTSDDPNKDMADELMLASRAFGSLSKDQPPTPSTLSVMAQVDAAVKALMTEFSQHNDPAELFGFFTSIPATELLATLSCGGCKASTMAKAKLSGFKPNDGVYVPDTAEHDHKQPSQAEIDRSDVRASFGLSADTSFGIPPSVDEVVVTDDDSTDTDEAGQTSEERRSSSTHGRRPERSNGRFLRI